MDAGLIIRVAGIGLCVAVCAQVLGKSGRDDMATLVSVAGIITVLFCLVTEVSALLESVKEIFGL